MRVENAIQPTAEQIRAFTSDPETGPIVMVNLLKFREKAAYSRWHNGFVSACTMECPSNGGQTRPIGRALRSELSVSSRLASTLRWGQPGWISACFRSSQSRRFSKGCATYSRMVARPSSENIVAINASPSISSPASR